MIIDERAYTAIKTLTYIAKKGGISNTLATASSIGVQDEMLLPILQKLSSHSLISMDARQPYPKLRLIEKKASAYQIISTVANITTEPELVEAFTAPNPSEKSRWIHVYQQVKSFEGKKSEELNGLTLLDLTKLYRPSMPTEEV